MDDTKVAVVNEWPNPMTVKRPPAFQGIWKILQVVYLGFQLYCHPKYLKWYQEANETFFRVNTPVTIGPILKHPDPSKPLIFEVDASESGVGTVLSQCFGDKSKLSLV